MHKLSSLIENYPKLTSLLFGSLMVLAFAPLSLWPIAIISIALLYHLVLNSPSAQQAGLRGYCFGFGFFLSSVSWVYVSIHDYGNSNILIASFLTLLFCLYLAIFPATTSLVFSKLHNKLPSFFKPILFACLWTIFEWLRGYLLTGFPWVFIGYIGLDSPLSGLVPIIGVYGLSFCFVLIACALCMILRASSNQRLVFVNTILLIFVLAYGTKGINWTQPSSKSSTVTLVQGNIPQNEKWSLDNEIAIIKKYIALTESHLNSDMIIWPEAAITRPLPYSQNIIEEIKEWLSKTNTQLITGIPLLDDNKQYYNTIISFNQNQYSSYAKTHLVPFGEYVPLENYLRGIIDFFNLPMSSFVASDKEAATLLAKNFNFKAAICYEIAYPSLVLKGVEHADILLTVSNDTWFGHSIGPKQHFQIARMRALETGRELIRVTNSGITAFVDSQGSVIKKADSFVETTLKGEIHARAGMTPLMYITHNGILAIISLLGLVTLLIGHIYQARATKGSANR